MNNKSNLFGNIKAHLERSGLKIQEGGPFEKKLKTASDTVNEISSQLESFADEAVDLFTEVVNEAFSEVDKETKEQESKEDSEANYDAIYTTLKTYYDGTPRALFEQDKLSVFRDGPLPHLEIKFLDWWIQKTGKELVLNEEISKNLDFWIMMHRTEPAQVLVEFIKEQNSK